MESEVECASSRRLDVRGCRGSADLPRARALRRGRPRRDRPRAAVHCVTHAKAVRVSGAALRIVVGRSVTPPDGPARAAEVECRYLELPEAGASRPPGAE